jgi:hypothetical protein
MMAALSLRVVLAFSIERRYPRHSPKSEVIAVIGSSNMSLQMTAVELMLHNFQGTVSCNAATELTVARNENLHGEVTWNFEANF